MERLVKKAKIDKIINNDNTTEESKEPIQYKFKMRNGYTFI